MGKQLIPEELQALIDQYLTDGVLTDKERAVILKKAEGMGLDRDEIDLYLDAEVQKIDQATDAAVRRQKGKSCPHCGAVVNMGDTFCSNCGKKFEDNDNPYNETSLKEKESIPDNYTNLASLAEKAGAKEKKQRMYLC